LEKKFKLKKKLKKKICNKIFLFQNTSHKIVKKKTKKKKSNPLQWGINLEVSFVFLSGDFFVSMDNFF